MTTPPIRHFDDVWVCAAWYTDCVVDWDALASIATIAATLVALLASAQAVRIEQRERAKEQRAALDRLAEIEARRAMLATTIDDELRGFEIHLEGLVQGVRHAQSYGDTSDITDQIIKWHRRVSTPLLSRYADSFSTFDIAEALLLADILAIALKYARADPAPGEIDNLADRAAIVQTARTIVRHDIRAIRKIRRARKHLEPYVRVAKLAR